jgi:hypothetical protein
MSFESILADIPVLRDAIPGQRVLGKYRSPIYVLDNFFFYSVPDEQYQKAEAIAKEISQISRGKKTRILSENSEVVGKLGEFVFREFCSYYVQDTKWQSFAEDVNPRGGDRCDALVAGLQVDVKTRQLHVDETIAPTFDLRVPYTEVEKYQDIYVLTGFCTASNCGYALGWCTWEELQLREIKQDIKFPAKCVPLLDLHPMLDLEKYAQRRVKLVYK